MKAIQNENRPRLTVRNKNASLSGTNRYRRYSTRGYRGNITIAKHKSVHDYINDLIILSAPSEITMQI